MRHRAYMFQHEGPDGQGGRLPWDAPRDLADRMRAFEARAKAGRDLFERRPPTRVLTAAAVAEDSR